MGAMAEVVDAFKGLLGVHDSRCLTRDTLRALILRKDAALVMSKSKVVNCSFNGSSNADVAPAFTALKPQMT